VLLATAILGTAAAQAVTLKQAVVQALETNPVIKTVAQNRKAIDQDLRVARGAYLPQLDVTTSYGIEFTNDVTTRASVERDTARLPARDVNIALTQRVFDGFETSNRVEREKARVRSAKWSVYENAEFLAFDAIRAYLEVVRQRETARHAEELVRLHVDTLNSLQQRGRAGVGTAADEFQTEVRLARAQALLAQSEGNLRDAEAIYLRIMGARPDKLTKPGIDIGVLPPGLNAALKQAQKNNPTVLVREANIDAAKSQVDVTEAPFFPKLNLEADANYEKDVGGINGFEKSARVALRLRWNLYRGGADRASRREALARLAEAKSQRLETLIDIQEGMRRAWSALQAATERVKRLNRAVAFSVRTRNTYRQQFQVGRRTLLDVLDSENELFTSRVQLITAEVIQLVSSHRILAISGSLLKTLEISLKAEMMAEPNSFIDDVF
jgi:adhesin transport system outer membrane protein